MNQKESLREIKTYDGLSENEKRTYQFYIHSQNYEALNNISRNGRG